MPYGRPPRKRPFHGFQSKGYVENLPAREQVPVNWEKMRNKYIPWTIMNMLSHQLGGYKYGMGALMTLPGLLRGQ